LLRRQKRTTLASLDEISPANAREETVAGRHLPTAHPYILPWNREEANRLNFQHYLLRQAMSGIYRAPIKRPRNILDVGCGTGRWAQEIAQAFPEANVIGLDIFEAPEANGSIKPSNYQFVMADALKGLPFSSFQFDFVHQRSLGHAIPSACWHQVVNELVRVTRPGGMVELVEPDSVFHNVGPSCAQLQNWIIAACRKCGTDPTEVRQIEAYLLAAGLMNIKTEVVSLPVGQWGGRLGMTTMANMRAACLAMKPLVLQQVGMNSQEYDSLLEDMFKECEERRSSFIVYVVYGQRPFR
jgi:ubiquinone/menaquinone biosynthesis C-methylase UbiE